MTMEQTELGRFLRTRRARERPADESLKLTRTDGQRLVVYMAAPGTADYDAVVLLDMAGFAGTDATPEASSCDSGLSNPR
jgi:hypothetical protein